MRTRRDRTVNVYKRVLTIVFDRLAPTFGQRTMAAIAKNALARESKEHEILKHLTVSEQGIGWDVLQDHMGEASEEQLSAGLEAFLDEFFEALSNLIGRLIVAKLFKEAEEMAEQGGEG